MEKIQKEIEILLSRLERIEKHGDSSCRGEAAELRRGLENINEKIRLLPRLQRQFRGWVHAVESLEDVILILDREQKIREINMAGRRLLGLSRQELLGKRISELSQIEASDFPAGDSPQAKGFETAVGDRLFSGTVSVFRDDETDKPSRIYILRDITDLKNRQEDLREQEKLYGLTFEQTALGVVQLTAEGRIMRFNRRFREMVGYTPEDLNGRDLYSLLDEDDRERQRRLVQVIEGGKKDSDSFEARLQARDGQAISIRIFTSAIRGPGGEIRFFLSLFSDLSELKETEVRFEQLFNNIDSGVAIYMPIEEGEDFLFVDLNRAGEGYSQVKAADIVGKSITEIFPGVREIGLLQALQRVSRSGEPEKLPLIQYQDERIHQWVENYIFRLPSGLVVTVYNDASKSKQAEAQIQLHNERLQSSLRITQMEAADVGELWATGLEEAIRLTSSKVGFIHFYDEQAAPETPTLWSHRVGQECKILEVPERMDDPNQGCWKQMVTYRKPLIFNRFDEETEYRENLPTNHIPLERVMLVPLYQHQRLSAVIGLGNRAWDYSSEDTEETALLMNTVWRLAERLRYQEELLKAKEQAEQSDRLKSAFLANMSHEIRTPMNGILGFAQLLCQPKLTEEKRQTYSDLIDTSCQRLLGTVNNILDTSLLDTGQLTIHREDIVLNELLQELELRYAPRLENIPIQFLLDLPDGGGAVVKGDPQRLRQILNNLLDNALKFTQAGHIRLGYRLKEAGVEFVVEDTGIGIAPDLQEAVFEQFRQADEAYTRQYEGSGLGLSITRSLVKLMGGCLTMESRPERGTLFRIQLPLEIRGDKPVPAEEEPEGLPAGSVPAVLVAEDEMVNYLYVEQLLERAGCRVYHAVNGKEAVEICREREDLTLVLMDIKMPDMNGFQAREEIARFNPELPMIALTAFAMNDDRYEIKKAGFQGYLPKPFSEEEFFEMIEPFHPVLKGLSG